jgi:hypothetical protein
MSIKSWVVAASVVAVVVGGSAVAYAHPLNPPKAAHFVIHDLPVTAADSPTSPDALAAATTTSQMDAAAALAAQEAAVAAQAAAGAAAAQAAADAAAKAAAVKAPVKRSASNTMSGTIRCPAGSQANSNDGTNDTSCFPVKCFTMVVDPADPAAADCLVAFKP